jgi:hypothetical protein
MYGENPQSVKLFCVQNEVFMTGRHHPHGQNWKLQSKGYDAKEGVSEAPGYECLSLPGYLEHGRFSATG